MHKNTKHPHECQEPINVDSTVAASTYRSHKSPVSQGTRLRKQIVIVLHLLLEPIVHTEWQTNCSFAHVGHFYKLDNTQDYFYTKEVTWGLRLPAAADLGIHGSELCRWGRPLPFSLGFCPGGGHQCWVNTCDDREKSLKWQDLRAPGTICELSVPKLAYFGDHQAKTCELNACQTSVGLKSLLFEWSQRKLAWPRWNAAAIRIVPRLQSSIQMKCFLLFA